MRRIIILLLASLAVLPAGAFGFKWKSTPVDGSRTGVTCPNADNVEAAMGRMEGRTYVAPNGRRFKGRTATAKAAKLMLEAQPGMADVKEAVGFCPTGLDRDGTENVLGDWAVDILMEATAAETGKAVDIGILNHGGIRIDMPQGTVLMDDMMSMFPFRNYLCHLTMKGSEVRALLEKNARRLPVIGGMKATVKDGKLVEALVGGESLDDARMYGVATIDFLVTGGDGIFSDREMEDIITTEVLVFDAVVDKVRELTAAGKPIEKERDGRVVDLSERRN
ncbi:MAG: 5'-nucleotidase C-terminal domain-containing protein [Bacteroidales bacterium]|nr:5'-nucleotidase C-terminal domain-containing protein [Bacteroidales bacterium]